MLPILLQLEVFHVGVIFPFRGIVFEGKDSAKSFGSSLERCAFIVILCFEPVGLEISRFVTAATEEVASFPGNELKPLLVAMSGLLMVRQAGGCF